MPQVVARPPNPIVPALQWFQSGDLDRARQWLEKFLSKQREHFDALHLLGVINAVGGAHEEAVARYQRAARIDGSHEELQVNLGMSLLALGRFEDALSHTEKALSLNGKNSVAHLTRGNALRGLARREEAIACFDRALAANSAYARAWANRGLTLCELKRYDEALASYDKALAIDPASGEDWSNRGVLLSEVRRYGEALASYDKALGFNPASAETWSNRGNALGELRRYDEALASFDKALAINPASAEAWSNRGIVLGELRRYGEAIASLDKALAIDSSHVEASYNRGLALSELKRHDEALACYERALELDPGLEYCLGNWLHTKMILCDWNALADGHDRMLANVERGFPALSPFASLAMPLSASQQKKCAETYVNDRYAGATSRVPAGGPPGGRKIRVGYFSSDFEAHAVSFLTAGLFESHDRNRFEIHGFGLARAENDRMRSRVVDAFDRFHDLSALDARQTVQVARQVGLDIAVDLNGHTSGARTEIFRERVAPVQVNYIGHPGTMGATFIDYIIGDRIVIPEQHRAGYSEKVVYLPDTFQANDAKRPVAVPASRRQYDLDEESFVFCCFNNSYKLTPEYFQAWLRLLAKVGNSVLWLVRKSDSQVARLKRLAEDHGVSAERIRFCGYVPYAEHLARYPLADLALDTSPFGGGATTSDALWCGVPVVTAMGNTFAGRMSASLLSAIGLPELVTGSLAEYEALAHELATHPRQLASFRERLSRHRSTHPLFDTALFTRHLESAYLKMYERHRAGLSPDHIHVAA